MSKLSWAGRWALLAVLTLSPMALGQPAGAIQGTVRNGTTSELLADVDVTLTSPAGGLSGERRTRTDARGRFRFDDVPARGFYLARVVHDDIIYNAATGISEPGQPAVVEVVVYDAAEPGEVELSLRRVRSAFRVIGDEMEIERLYRVSNPTQKTVPGTSDAFRFQLQELPANLSSQAKQTAWLDVAVVPTADDQAYTVRFDMKPGETDVSLHYHLPYADQRFLAEETLFHLAAEVVMEVGPDGLELNPSESLEDAGWQAGTQIYRAADVLAGQTLSVEIQGEPVGTAIVRGQVVNGTTGQPASGVPLELTRLSSGGHGHGASPLGEEPDVRTWTTRSDVEGRFLFESIPVAADAIFALRSSYRGADYTEHVSFSDEREVDVELAIYDVVPRDQVDLSVPVVDLRIFVDGHRLIQRVYYRFENPTRMTVEAPSALQLGLPEEAENVRCEVYTMFAGQPIPNERRPRRIPGTAGLAAVDWPVKPGVTELEIFYELPYRGEIDLELPLPEGAGAISATVGPSTLDVASSGLSFVKKLDTSSHPGGLDLGELYVYEGGPLSAGSRVSFSLSGEAHMPRSLIPTMSSWHQGSLFLILTAGLGMILAGVALGLGLRSASSDQELRQRERELLLEELVRLDDRFERGELARVEYEQRRLLVCGRLREIWRA